ncbi:MAG TPA: LacI family DNA-binding transcriptional regulator [Acidobacteriaceae bacterium]|nr:LacI family DNA-binding transcriptional regulator [Acidobacteriaceae bacterium]
MRDVAERAGVGMMTVSRVLNGTAHVADDTSARVYRALKELQYQPNLMARALRGRRTRSIGVIVPYLYDPFFASCAHAISSVAKQHAYTVLLATSDENCATETEAAHDLLRRHVEGIIVIPACDGHSHLNDSEFRSIPKVALDRPIPRSRIDQVVVENQNGAALATEHLIQHGHKRICFLGLDEKIFTMHARAAGYIKAMHAAGLEPERFFNAGDEVATLDFLRAVCTRSDPVTAVFAANGLSSRHALRALAALNIQIPEQLAFIGFDDFDLADILRPSLTVIRQPVQRAGEEAAQLLFTRLESNPAAPTQKLSLPVELILRRSCGCHPG